MYPSFRENTEKKEDIAKIPNVAQMTIGRDFSMQDRVTMKSDGEKVTVARMH